ncbi:MAG TPA: hypothetical protein VD948_08660 [Rhodothermales bacterium]|nr:hypothetical protein [Rhodothermales bacterium]
MATVWTIAQAALNEKEPLRKGIYQVFWMESNAMAAIPWTTVNRLDVSMMFQKRTSLSKPGWVAIGDSYAESYPELEPKQEQVFKIGRDLKIKKGLENLQGQFVDPRVLSVETTMKELAYEFNEAFINGPMINSDGSGNPNALVGIQRRIDDLDGQTGLADAKVIVGGDGGNGTAFGPTASSANRHAVLDALNKTLYFIDGKRPDWGFCNSTLLLAIESAFRREGLFASTRDQYERIVYTYREVPLYDIGLKADQSTQIITDTEVQGTSSDCTSLYWGKNGVWTYTHGWEKEPLDVRDLGELQTSPQLLTRVDWTLGLANWHPRALSRVAGIRATT